MRRLWLAFVFFTLVVVPAHAAPSTRTLDDYRHFRIAAIDLLGRMPTRAEVAQFEQPTFDFDKWIDAHLSGPAYTERLTRIYMDLLRLEPNLNFPAGQAQLYRYEIQVEGGAKQFVYYRNNQRRIPEAIDGEFCFSPDEIGVVVRGPTEKTAPTKVVSKKLFAERTVAVKPWWLYKDYKASPPKERYGEGWKDASLQYKLDEGLLSDPDGKPTAVVHVCKEEAAHAEKGHFYLSGRTKVDKEKEKDKDARFAGGRPKPPPIDKPFAIQHKNELVDCSGRVAAESSAECGCGLGLERCFPSEGTNNGGTAFHFPNKQPLGPGSALDSVKQRADRWYPYWWSREAVHFLDDLFASDRDFRQILTGHQTFVNGPLVQYYRSIQKANCCGPEATLQGGMIEEDAPLFDAKNAPADLAPTDVDTWRPVSDRGPHAAGILTTSMFLHKYATARARGAVLYNAFLCKSFIAENAQLTPSTEPNLMKRPGCQTCHATLEPLAAYFARVEPSSTVFLPANHFPVVNAVCKKDKNGKLNGPCNQLYDVAFADAQGATLRSAYGSLPNADAGPDGAGKAIGAMPEFAECAVQRVTSSFLGRPTTPDDATLLTQLQKDFVVGGFHMKTLVRGIVRSAEYRKANNMSSAVTK